jgi:predicted transcriptional regulator of viral defense system
MAAAPINRRTKLARGEPELIERLSRSDQLVYSPHQLTELFRAMRERGIYSKQASYEDFLGFVLRRGHLTQIALTAPHYDETLLCFCRGQAEALDIGASLRSSAYFSHSTAAYLNGLTTTLPNALYLNLEQSAKPKSDSNQLNQESLDRAFSGNQRQSRLFYTHEKLTVTMLSGKKTGRLAVESIAASTGRSFSATNLERTLIDLTVRPAYAGGIQAVLECFRTARPRVSIEKLLQILDQLDYVYPYAQAIGFLAQRAGFATDDLKLLQNRITPLKFYLAHGMKNPTYDETWRIHRPIDL